jgi:hypothetical protein
MHMLGGDVAQVNHIMSNNGETLLNVYYFEAVDGTADLGALLTWMAANFVDDTKALQSTTVTHVALEAVNIFDKGETDTLALSGTGAISGTEVLPPFTCASIRLLHTQAGMRSGWKRVGPTVEGSQSNGVWTAGYLTNVQNFGAQMLNPLSPALATWAHVIVKRIKVIDVVTGAVSYRLPEIQGELTVGYPVAYEASVNVTTQNSRKTGTP